VNLGLGTEDDWHQAWLWYPWMSADEAQHLGFISLDERDQRTLTASKTTSDRMQRTIKTATKHGLDEYELQELKRNCRPPMTRPASRASGPSIS
jgi:hypothetical protein